MNCWILIWPESELLFSGLTRLTCTWNSIFWFHSNLKCQEKFRSANLAQIIWIWPDFFLKFQVQVIIESNHVRIRFRLKFKLKILAQFWSGETQTWWELIHSHGFFYFRFKFRAFKISPKKNFFRVTTHPNYLLSL